jgi:hypothetical protein
LTKASASSGRSRARAARISAASRRCAFTHSPAFTTPHTSACASFGSATTLSDTPRYVRRKNTLSSPDRWNTVACGTSFAARVRCGSNAKNAWMSPFASAGIRSANCTFFTVIRFGSNP